MKSHLKEKTSSEVSYKTQDSALPFCHEKKYGF